MRALRSIPVSRRYEAAAVQFAQSLKGGPLARVTYREHPYEADKTETWELVGLGQQLSRAYGPCLVLRDPAKVYELRLVPLTMLHRIEPAVPFSPCPTTISRSRRPDAH